jgi:hypothetical protein
LFGITVLDAVFPGCRHIDILVCREAMASACSKVCRLDPVLSTTPPTPLIRILLY